MRPLANSHSPITSNAVAIGTPLASVHTTLSLVWWPSVKRLLARGHLALYLVRVPWALRT